MFIEENSKDNNLMDSSVKVYLKEIAKYPILSKEEERNLLKKYKEESDIESYQKLIHHNLRLSVFIAKKYYKNCNSMTLFDLIQECNIILMDAIEKFDSTKGDSLGSYAIVAMHRRLKMEIDYKDKIIRMPIYLEEKISKYKNYITSFYFSHQRKPTDDEIKNDLLISTEGLEFLKTIPLFNCASLDTPIEDGEGNTTNENLEVMIPDKSMHHAKFDNFIDSQILKMSLKTLLSEIEYYIIYSRVMLENKKSLDYLGKVLDVSSQTISNREKSILEKLKKLIIDEQKKVTKNHKIDALMKMNLDPILPEEKAIYYCMKNCLDDLTYFIMYQRRFIKENNNILYYQQKFPLASLESINYSIKLCVELEKRFKQDSFIFKSLDILKKNYTIDEIFKLNLRPVINKKYHVLTNYFNDYSFDDIQITSHFNELDSSQQLLVKRYFQSQNYKEQPLEKYVQIEKDINYSLLGEYKLKEREVKSDFKRVKKNLSNDEVIKIESYFEKLKNNSCDKHTILVDVMYYLLQFQNKPLFSLYKMTNTDMKAILVSKSIKLSKNTQESIKCCYNISERDLMTYKEKRKVLKLLKPLYVESNKANQKRK